MPSVNGGPAITSSANQQAVLADPAVSDIAAGATPATLTAAQGAALGVAVVAMKSDGTRLAADGSVLGAPTTEGADRALTAADADRILVCAAARSFTVNSGMPASFGPAAVGAGVVTFTAGAGVSITDKRTTGATNPSCCLMPVGTDTYYVVGSKA